MIAVVEVRNVSGGPLPVPSGLINHVAFVCGPLGGDSALYHDGGRLFRPGATKLTELPRDGVVAEPFFLRVGSATRSGPVTPILPKTGTYRLQARLPLGDGVAAESNAVVVSVECDDQEAEAVGFVASRGQPSKRTYWPLAYDDNVEFLKRFPKSRLGDYARLSIAESRLPRYTSRETPRNAFKRGVADETILHYAAVSGRLRTLKLRAVLDQALVAGLWPECPNSDFPGLIASLKTIRPVAEPFRLTRRVDVLLDHFEALQPQPAGRP